LGNGENIMPTAIESDLYDALHAQGLKNAEILLAGTSRPIPAILVEGAGDQRDAMQKVFSVLLPKLSATLPAFFPLRPEMVYYLDPKEEFVRTVKGARSFSRVGSAFGFCS
jgi:hypothetical protein